MNRKELETLLEAARCDLEQKIRAQLPAPKTEVEAFMRAAGEGDIPRVQEFLASGMPVDTIDEKGCTALIYAFDNLAMVQVLLAAGANSNGPEPEPASLTPLIQVATLGRIDTVRALLQAGADPNFRSYFPLSHKRPGYKTRTAIDHARSNRHKKVVELLQASTRPGRADFAFEAIKSFAAAAAQPAYGEVLHKLTSICGHSPRRWRKAKGVYSFFLSDFAILAAHYGEEWLPDLRLAKRRAESARAERYLERLQEEVRAAGYYLVLAESRGELLEAKLRLFPAAEKYAVVAASGLESHPRVHTTTDLIEWLLDLDQENPFVITGCSHTSLTGLFLQPIRNAAIWAERIAQMCPDFDMTGEALAKDMEETRMFYLGWI